VEGEEVDAQVGRAFEVGEEVGEEVVGVGVAAVGVVGVGGAIAVVCRGSGLPVVEYDNFVDAEDGEGAGDLAGEGALEIVGLGTGGAVLAKVREEWGIVLASTYFAIMLPGRATLRVWVRPGPGWKTAVGLEVSTVLSVVGRRPRFRFWVQSALS